ncbi:STAS domain-containing protein [Kibdelosporangium phytohabitans]|uniref:Anti-anti-sigma factor n=1 Tax=Kibdelosporangium phytohabitans TaxID=860235 RepID=A0A0N9I7S3_9PSEU|nr:STAS domain-containing protein [Kibdelosporangium phytohabitans]ALG10562.1 anti-anti-sigma factor [Kibdelosporangium phytohabitans]MBE1461666.1 anti-anti-sigma factor [Kibdelosporangium phytohabitans]
MTTPLTVTTSHDTEGAVTLKVAGEIDMTNSDSFAAAIDDAPGRLVVDLSGVEYMDSAGLSVLFIHADRIEVIVPELLAPVVAFSGLSAMTTVHGRRTSSGSGQEQ